MTPDPADFLEALVRIPSPSGEEAEASAWLAARMSAVGFSRARVDEAGNAVGEMGDAPRVLMLLGHIDTVPGLVPVRRDAGALYGRGAVDAKGPLAALVLSVARLGAVPGWRLVVAGAVEEESATSKGARAIARAWRPEACVIGEPSGWQKLCVGYKGRLLLECRLTLPAGHSAGPDRGACEVMVDYWNAVDAHAAGFNAERSTIFHQVTPSLRTMRSQSDGLEERAEATIGLRLPPGLDLPRLKADLLALARERAPALTVEFRGEEEAFRAGKSNPLVRAFLGAIRRHDAEPAFRVKTGTSDMNVVGPLWNCPILAYGPGDSRYDHTPDERIEIAELEKGIAVLEVAIRDFTRTG